MAKLEVTVGCKLTESLVILLELRDDINELDSITPDSVQKGCIRRRIQRKYKRFMELLESEREI
jgi:hypothetical protein